MLLEKIAVNNKNRKALTFNYFIHYTLEDICYIGPLGLIK